ncbi:XRE family transcriptional regulator, partial [Streptomyces sp. NPDC058762]
MARPQPAELWAELNPRQQTYLTAIYNADQNAEANHRGDAVNWGHGPPASEWRWQTFSIKAPKDLVGRTAIQYELASKDEHDQGAGSSLAALRRRGLI